MKILFLTTSEIKNLDEQHIYLDTLKEFEKRGNEIYIASLTKEKDATRTLEYGNILLKRIFVPLSKSRNKFLKGLSLILTKYIYMKSINKYFNKMAFDVIIYATPPITLYPIIKKVKKENNAITYLLLKDIFPQNAVDLEMMKISSLIYKYFRRMEKKLYAISDFIGCMSEANMKYIIKHNPDINIDKVHISPNTISYKSLELTVNDKKEFLKRYGINTSSKKFIYGGNLGEPQGINFLIDVIKECKDVFFIVVGDGTKFNNIKSNLEKLNADNYVLLKKIPKEDYEKLVKCCDIGLIFLDARFTIPNFPSRLLSYLSSSIPVISATDVNTDIGDLIEMNNFGFKCINGDMNSFKKIVNLVNHSDLIQMGKNGFNYYIEKYQPENSYKIIMKKIKEIKENV